MDVRFDGSKVLVNFARTNNRKDEKPNGPDEAKTDLEGMTHGPDWTGEISQQVRYMNSLV